MALLAGKMLHKPKQYLAEEVLSWSVHDILIQKPPPFMVETIPTEFKTGVDYSKAFHNLILLEIWHNICSAMDDISSGMDVEVSENRSGFIIKLHVAKGKDCPNKGDIMLLSSRESKSRDQIFKDDGLCTIVVVKNITLWYERSDNSKRGWMTVSLSKLPHGGNPSQEGLYQVMHLENLSTYECC
ncbi:hypothetical protein PVAP13_5KG169428, partial [Panicum virgatum]